MAKLSFEWFLLFFISIFIDVFPPAVETPIASLALKIVGVVVPSEVVAGRDALLQCHYDLEGSSLYALKWYKGSHGNVCFLLRKNILFCRVYQSRFSVVKERDKQVALICWVVSRNTLVLTILFCLHTRAAYGLGIMAGTQNSIASSWKKCRPCRRFRGPASLFITQVAIFLHASLFFIYFYLITYSYLSSLNGWWVSACVFS